MTSSSADELPVPHDPQRERVLLRDAADIRRLALRIATRWRLPHVEIGTERFPKLTAQRMQDRIGRLAKGCNCLLGEVLGGTVLVVGICWVWVTGRTWQDLGWVLLATINVGLVGKVLELAWTRVRLLWALWVLRRRMDAPQEATSHIPREFARVEAARLARLENPVAVATSTRTPRTRRARAPRPKVLLQGPADIRRLYLRLLTRWTLPRIEVRIDGLPARDEQRATHRYARLSDGASFMTAGVLATLVLLVGLLHAILTAVPEWETSQREDWWLQGLGWDDVQPVLLAALVAGISGWVIERLWTRVRLLWVLRRLRVAVNRAKP